MQASASFSLDGPTFEIIRQITNEIPDFRGPLMVEEGWTYEIDRFLCGVVRSLPGDLTPGSSVRISIVEDSEMLPEIPRKPELPLGTGEEAVRNVPRHIGRVWPLLLGVAWEGLGPLEARYRTGYREAEITSALAQFVDGVNSSLTAINAKTNAIAEKSQTLLAAVSDRIPADQLHVFEGLSYGGEWGLLVDGICATLVNRSIRVTPAEVSMLRDVIGLFDPVPSDLSYIASFSQVLPNLVVSD